MYVEEVGADETKTDAMALQLRSLREELKGLCKAVARVEARQLDRPPPDNDSIVRTYPSAHKHTRQSVDPATNANTNDAVAPGASVGSTGCRLLRAAKVAQDLKEGRTEAAPASNTVWPTMPSSGVQSKKGRHMSVQSLPSASTGKRDSIGWGNLEFFDNKEQAYHPTSSCVGICPNWLR